MCVIFQGFALTEKKKLINDTYIRGYFRRDCKFYDFSTTVFTQTYNLLFRYVIAIPSLQRATSNLNSCNIFFQALRTSPIAAVFIFLNMVHHDEDSERKFLSFDFDAHRRTSLFCIVAGPQNYFESLLAHKDILHQVGVNFMEVEERCSIMGGNRDTGSTFFICLEFSEFAMYGG